jgi:hypothetical protein
MQQVVGGAITALASLPGEILHLVACSEVVRSLGRWAYQLWCLELSCGWRQYMILAILLASNDAFGHSCVTFISFLLSYLCKTIDNDVVF